MKISWLLMLDLLLFSIAAGHSWLDCTDWDSSSATCNGRPRRYHEFYGQSWSCTGFACDQGFNFQPTFTLGSGGEVCGQTRPSDLADGYTASYPMARWTAGAQVTLRWPAKNHAMVYPDSRVYIWSTPSGATSDAFDISTGAEVTSLLFSNCDPPGSGVDAASCTGTFTAPSWLAGSYSLMWWWEFNKGQFYSTCFDITLISSGGATTTSTPTAFPTNNPITAVASPTAAPPGAATPPSGTPPGSWKAPLKATHFWDCNGGACDATVLQPWIESKYSYAAQYAPMDPADHGGAAYGEHMWLTGAASDTLSSLMGTDDGCCGATNPVSGGCGRCLLIKNPDAVNADWSAVVMKKNRCPPESNGCEAGKAHLDIAVPGYDNLAYSTANICGSSSRTETFLTKSQSSICGSWYERGASTDIVGACDCSSLPSSTPEEKLLLKGCTLFTSWGWQSGDPSQLSYQVVACPSEFSAIIGAAFGAAGVTAAAPVPAPTKFPTGGLVPTPSTATNAPTSRRKDTAALYGQWCVLVRPVYLAVLAFSLSHFTILLRTLVLSLAVE